MGVGVALAEGEADAEAVGELDWLLGGAGESVPAIGLVGVQPTRSRTGRAINKPSLRVMAKG